MTLIMGVVNATPDSFSGDGRDAASAVRHGFDLVSQGADMLDIGAESTRPGFTPVSPREQIDRLIPVLQGLTAAGVPLSVDTMSAEVAHTAIAAGANMVNDVSGGLGDPAMLELVAASEVDYVCCWWTGWPSHEFSTVISGRPIWRRTADELLWRRDACLDAGIEPRRIVLDPGLGFGKSAGDNWQILAHLDTITALGHRVLVAASRKRFLNQSDVATTAVTAWCVQHGAWAVRVHDVAGNRAAIAVMDRLAEGAGQ